MPTAAPRPCNHPGCREYQTAKGYCAAHQKDRRQYDERRGTAAQRGYNAEWRRARAEYLRRNPLCVCCLEQNRVTPSTVVDHIKPHKGNMKLFWDQTNWQALCKTCHDRKTMTEDMGAWDRGPSKV